MQPRMPDLCLKWRGGHRHRAALPGELLLRRRRFVLDHLDHVYASATDPKNLRGLRFGDDDLLSRLHAPARCTGIVRRPHERGAWTDPQPKASRHGQLAARRSLGQVRQSRYPEHRFPSIEPWPRPNSTSRRRAADPCAPPSRRGVGECARRSPAREPGSAGPSLIHVAAPVDFFARSPSLIRNSATVSSTSTHLLRTRECAKPLGREHGRSRPPAANRDLAAHPLVGADAAGDNRRPRERLPRRLARTRTRGTGYPTPGRDVGRWGRVAARRGAVSH